ncbi:hypothetical protein GS399_09735 [Pedobacter sp. HMF7647]|uniref:Uncharacterized protein n=1 Tax=Hufsiella arboris TaxID=2695275 RepID=A0A7K1YB18_9SPHI|nr:hypothetical protein [Hufsiella arboris]MXV51248.1 hypothetical protein [Hufsiella arboris]
MLRAFTITFIFSAIVTLANAQTITHARFKISNRNDGIQSVELLIDDRFYIGLTGNGGVDYIQLTTRTPLAVEDMDNLGMPLTWYDQSDIHDIPGKIKSIGGIQIVYNNVFDIHERKGTLKSIGDIPISYYNVFDIHDPQGKVKSIGKIQIEYYNAFDSKELFGRIKSIKGNSRDFAVVAGR